ncbi:hypothetical protein OPS25_11835 [Alteromonas ponticola]|uniref:Peptidase M1 membrane alanine aminopeptidase domain-containing protein n=1 Tax=Alteromonas aquimaris TaxID=2998417 RepID=A0ABT3P8Z1_9ALTE|nr:hypothetical protein [Alteromonas aquimaris]
MINKSAKNWTVSYISAAPIRKIVFANTPNDAREKRWHPQDLDFEIVYEDQKEYVQRKDGRPFTHVQFELTPTYTHLPKAYAPFAPFSDGGALIHTGRFFACASKCSTRTEGWPINIYVDKSSHIIANGELYQHSASWTDYDDGQYVYVGQQVPLEGTSFIAMIDEGLPNKIKTALQETIPQLMRLFESHLGDHGSEIKPMLFASYSNSQGGDIQGGTLPRQIFIHWDMNNLETLLADEHFVLDTLWMFAHEVAHFYQGIDNIGLTKTDSWIHEGNAEWLAALAFQELYGESSVTFVDKKVHHAKTQCIEALQYHSLQNAAQHSNYRAYYDCGMIINRLLDDEIRRQSNSTSSIFTFWTEFREAAQNTDDAGAPVFWDTMKSYVSAETHENLKQLVTRELKNPRYHIENVELK